MELVTWFAIGVCLREGNLVWKSFKYEGDLTDLEDLLGATGVRS